MNRRKFLKTAAGTAAMMCDASAAQAAKVCSRCKGSGTGNIVCSSCKGTGKQGNFKCSSCNGKGFIKCSSCNGTGQVA